MPQDHSAYPSITFKASDWRKCVDWISQPWFPGNVVLQRRQTVQATAMKKSSPIDHWNWEQDSLPGVGYDQQEELKHGGAVSVTEAFQLLAAFFNHLLRGVPVSLKVRKPR